MLVRCAMSECSQTLLHPSQTSSYKQSSKAQVKPYSACSVWCMYAHFPKLEIPLSNFEAKLIFHPLWKSTVFDILSTLVSNRRQVYWYRLFIVAWAARWLCRYLLPQHDLAPSQAWTFYPLCVLAFCWRSCWILHVRGHTSLQAEFTFEMMHFPIWSNLRSLLTRFQRMNGLSWLAASSADLLHSFVLIYPPFRLSQFSEVWFSTWNCLICRPFAVIGVLRQSEAICWDLLEHLLVVDFLLQQISYLPI